MGGKDNTKKTLEQVQQELFREIYLNARALLSNPSSQSETPTFENLERVLDAVARERFQSHYGYAYQGAQSTPKEHNIRNLSGLDALLNITSDSDGQIEGYVDLLLNGVGITSVSVKNNARAGLVEQGRQLFRSRLSNNWTTMAFNHVYEDPEPTQFPWKAEMMMVQCNAGLTIDGHSAQYTLLYFVGVYFERLVEQVLRDQLFSELLENARKLPNADTSETRLTVQAMQNTLDPAAMNLFRATYGVNFEGNNTRPGDLATGRESSVRGTRALFYLQTADPPNLETFVETVVLSAMDFYRNEVKFAKEQAYSTLTTQLTDLLNNQTGQSWLSSSFTRTYISHALNEDSLRTIANLYFTNAERVEGSQRSQLKFIFYIGVYYHVPSPSAQAISTLVVRLYDTARVLFNPPKSSIERPTESQLVDLLKEHQLIVFRNEFGIEYRGDRTEPNNLATPRRLSGYAHVVAIRDDDWTNLRSILENEIFSALDIAGWVEDAAIDRLVTAFNGAKNAPDDGSWRNARQSRTFDNTINHNGFNWRTSAVLTYARVALREGNIDVIRTFISYTGIYYAINQTNGLRSLTESLDPSVELLELEEHNFLVL